MTEETRRAGKEDLEGILPDDVVRISRVVIDTRVCDSLAGVDPARPSLRGPRLVGDQDLLMVPRRLVDRASVACSTTSSSGSASHPPGSRNAPLLLPLLPPRLLHRRPRPRPPPGQPVRRDVERQPAAVVVADRTGDRGALPQILLRSRRAELHSRGGHAASTRGATEQRNAARRISPGCVSASAVSDEGDPPSPLRTTKIAHSLSLPLANREVLPVRLGHNEFSARPVRWQG